MGEVVEKEMTEEEVGQEDGRARVLAEIVKHWNSFARGLLSATTAWERYSETMLEHSVHIEEFPLEIQKLFARAHPKGDYDIILEDIITRPRLKEYLKTLFVTIK